MAIFQVIPPISIKFKKRRFTKVKFGRFRTHFLKSSINFFTGKLFQTFNSKDSLTKCLLRRYSRDQKYILRF